MITSANEPSGGDFPLTRSFAFIASWVAVISGLYHIAAIYLLPLPGELHPNMHLLFAFVIVLFGGAAAQPGVYGEKFRELGVLPLVYLASLFPAVFFFYFIENLEWSESRLWWVYALPFFLWGAMILRQGARLALGLLALSFLPAALLFANWSALPESVQAPTTWWLFLMSAVPAAAILFGIFHRPFEAIRRGAGELIVLAAVAAAIVWRIALWSSQPDEVRSFAYLFFSDWYALPAFALAALAVWVRKGLRAKFRDFPSHPHPPGLTFGLNAGMLFFGMAACIYLFYFHADMVDRPGAPTFEDTRVGFIMIVVALELTRRCFGPPLPTLSVIAIAYGLWGNLFPPPFGHGGAEWTELLGKLSTDFIGGIIGFLVIISATFIIMFLLLGAFLHESGAGRFFVNFALGIFGRMRAGAGLAAVGASALMGTVSGSASGNVVTTGTFTIPLMKRIGLSPHIAAAAEAAASTGGQIMPPVMGAGAFIMSELIEVPYFQLIGYAAIPAVLYFLIVGINIHFAAGSLDIRPMPREEIPDWRDELRSGWIYLVPLGFLVWFLFEGRTPTFAGVMAVFVMVGIWFYRSAAEFLASLREGEREVSDAVFVFVPVSFFVFLGVAYALLVIVDAMAGGPFALDASPSWRGAARSGAAFSAICAALGGAMLRLVPGAPAFWRECRRGWLSIFPLCAALIWAFLGWSAGTAGAALSLGGLALWLAARGRGFETYAVVPWLFVIIYGAVFAAQWGIYALFPAISEFSEWVRPFGFIYHVIIFFGLASLVQRIIWGLAPPRESGDASPLRTREVAAGFCNPYLYIRRARREGRDGPDVAAAEGNARWLGSVRHALEVGGRQGAEFGVTLASIELVVQVLSITGIGNKFAYLIETLSVDYCLIGAAAGGGCTWWLGVDGFFVGLFLTAVTCAILGMGMPTTAAYVLLAILGGPAVIALVRPEMIAIHGAEWTNAFIAIKGDRVAAHMFIFYFAILSAITPPVAIASLVGAKIAGAPYFKTSMMALRFAIVGFVVPFLFMYQPALLALDRFWVVVAVTALTLFAFTAFSAATQGFFLRPLRFLERFLLFACTALTILFIITFHWVFLAGGLAAGTAGVAKQFGGRSLEGG